MPLPVLLVVGGDQDALQDVGAQLARRYGRDYRIERASDPEQALAALAELADACDELALVLAATSLMDSTGEGLLERARQLHPHAKRGLMVARGALADQPTAKTIVDAIAMGRIDYYVQMPAEASDETFHHTISTFLLEWATELHKVPHTVRIVGEEWTGRAYEMRETFERCAVPHDFCLADSDEGRKLLAQAGLDVKLPVMLLPDGRALSDPSNAEIAEAAGAPAGFDESDFDVVIVGAGPAGLSAAVYGASEGLRTLVVDEGGIGGQARSSSLIRNYLGFPRGVSGHRLAVQAYEQASVFGASFVFLHRATALSRSGEQLTLSLTEDRRVNAAVVILATGASYRRLGVPALEALTGAGVFYGGPAAEAHALSGADVFVAGGGNSAGQAVLYLARYARSVTLIVRGPSLEAGMSHYLVQEIRATPSIDVRTSTTVVGGGGDGHLRELVLRDAAAGDEEAIAADALFVLIGARPHTDWLPHYIARDRYGFLYTGGDVPSDDGWPLERSPSSLETSMPGVLAAGDVRHGSVKRVASAVGEGSIAVQLVHNLLVSEQSAERRTR
ncbi:FAD-dependent oxidoreductase [Conexibacter woesei]|uniref:FAD-dependent pyridine nucleotide-disulphide oxidoreductase n=1 Tax=Conexibacter woesei (strain DSM 14684 / CCUG 47730 / CIP 108061 / JCM 11494 / NBRC 100937 / ID131577) TaxID=469383 RepID=D3F371_CONWI|nr:FAD-dependent oxidoreductase [Conexibacter woesei]ADB50351.1 FAD-dependent pyridine nucleotide-disulphide oxidoreductase [Conexibacter woesei DSM 14684]